MGDVEAALDERDPEFIRRRLADTWPLVRRWFRAEVRGLELIPDGPVLVVGNHSGGNLTPDSVILALAYNEYAGAERPSYALTDDIGPTSTRSSFFRKFGAISPSPRHAKAAFDRDAVVLVYPGNNEVHRPSWHRHRIDLGGRHGWARLARDHNVPVVPAVAIGGQETALFLTRGETLARALRLDRLFGIRELPLSIALPWGLNVGDFLGHIPLPAKIVIQLLPPMTVGDDPRAAYREITGRMQAALTGMAAERRFPVIG
ncbi:1-acyl-sn-glycerol-3-phosphate acyltransferase [Actinosynnema sp. ALI-1.44]|uniref:1-acyl-sn-glycerol-3-phosphate acyltransferase n=1 Tax=Actinosynnema sp. ALI-1.44 TaxID=1933779 RepID=UPI00192CED99|nr:1-acyl-sn-glycerol-3-phosphate acyltransferase [Actinosynnema sp. ALI-1.44]